MVRNRTKIKLIFYPRSCLHRLCSTHDQGLHRQFSTHAHYPRSVLVSLPTVSSQYPPTISSGFSTHGQFSVVPTHNQFRLLYPRSALSTHRQSVPVSLPTVSSEFSQCLYEGKGEYVNYLCRSQFSNASTYMY